jgi:hypothetical protein
VGVDEELQAEGQPRRPGRSSSANRRRAELRGGFQTADSNETHVSTTDPDAKLYRKGPAWKPGLASSAIALMENLLIDACLIKASGQPNVSLRRR